jgi:predicted nuclease with TOPRIM domain
MAKQPTTPDSLEKTLENLKKKNSTQREKLKALEAYGKKMKEKLSECDEQANMACSDLEDLLTAKYNLDIKDLVELHDEEMERKNAFFIKVMIGVFFLGFAVGGILVTATI